MRTLLHVLVATIAIAVGASRGEPPILQIQLSSRSYDISKFDLLTEWKVKIDMVTQGAHYAPQQFNTSLLVTFPVSSSDVSRLYCDPPVLGNLIIWPYEMQGPLQSSLIELEVKQVSDVVRHVIESSRDGLANLVVKRSGWKQEAMYDEVSKMLIVCEIRKIKTSPSIFLQEFTFRDDALEICQRIADSLVTTEARCPGNS